MAVWSASMQQTFEYYQVNPDTWMNESEIGRIKSCGIDWDKDKATLGSARIDSEGLLGEAYVRPYLVTIQNGIKDRYPLGTFLVQTPSYDFDGKAQTASMDAYTPLLELKEKSPPLGYTVLKGSNIMETAVLLCRENTRAPVVPAGSDAVLADDFSAEPDDTWLSFLADLIANAKFEFGLDELGRILFQPVQDTAALQPVWTYDDGNSSILYPDITVERDLYGIPNVVEVLYSRNSGYYYSRAVNDDTNSPTSTVSRGREVVHRVTDAQFAGDPTQEYIDEYARQLLRNLSSLEFTLTYSHGYCPVRVGDCVLLNYSRAGLKNVKARVTSQSIKCEPGCPVTETAVFTNGLWR